VCGCAFRAVPGAPLQSTPTAAPVAKPSGSLNHDNLFLPCSHPNSRGAPPVAVKPLAANTTHTHNRPATDRLVVENDPFLNFFLAPLSQSQCGQPSPAANANDAKPATKQPSLAAAAPTSDTLEMFGLGLTTASISTTAASAAAPAKPKRKLGDLKAEVIELSDGE
jgi:hypothetical protein